MNTPPSDESKADRFAGLVVLTPTALPNLATLEHAASDDSAASSSPLALMTALAEYLAFLELIVIYRGLLVFDPTYSKEVQRARILHPSDHLKSFFPRGQLFEDTMRALTNQRLIAVVVSDKVRGDDAFRRYSPILPGLSQSLANATTFAEAVRDSANEHGVSVEEVAFALAAVENGGPLAVADKARELRLPMICSADESLAVQMLESTERALAKPVANSLVETLNQSASHQLEFLKTMGLDHFPDTPIASQILREAIAVEDLLDVTFQFRDEFAQFRESCALYQHEMMREDTSLRRRMELVREIEAQRRTLWPHAERTVKRDTSEAASLIAETSTAFGLTTLGSYKELLSFAIRLPLEFVLRAVRTRRVRILQTIARDFLSSPDGIHKVASMFKINQDVVTEGLVELREVQLRLKRRAREEEPGR